MVSALAVLFVPAHMIKTRKLKSMCLKLHPCEDRAWVAFSTNSFC